MSTRALGNIWRANAGPGVMTKGFFDDSIFQRMEGDNRYPALRGQGIYCIRQTSNLQSGGNMGEVPQMGQFIINGNPECLKRTGGRMNSTRTRLRRNRL